VKNTSSLIIELSFVLPCFSLCHSCCMQRFLTNLSQLHCRDFHGFHKAFMSVDGFKLFWIWHYKVFICVFIEVSLLRLLRFCRWVRFLCLLVVVVVWWCLLEV